MPLNVLTPDAKTDAGVSLGGNDDPTAPGVPLTIYASGIRNAFTLLFDSTGQLWAPANGSSSGGNTPAGGGGPALTDVQQVEEDTLFKVEPAPTTDTQTPSAANMFSMTAIPRPAPSPVSRSLRTPAARLPIPIISRPIMSSAFTIPPTA